MWYIDRFRRWVYSLFPYRLTIHTLHSGPDWSKCETILHAAFQLLVNYMDQEHPGEIIDWDCNDDHRHAWTEMNELYHWWTVDRPNRDTIESITDGLPQPDLMEEFTLVTEGEHAGNYQYTPHKDKYSEYYDALHRWNELERSYDDEDDENLRRLIAVRHYMWT